MKRGGGRRRVVGDLEQGAAGVVEGFNGTAKQTTRKAFGFRTPQGIEIALSDLNAVASDISSDWLRAAVAGEALPLVHQDGLHAGR